jgi:CTP synthase
LFCGVNSEAVIESRNVETIYEVPVAYERAGLGDYVCQRLGLEPSRNDFEEWEGIVHTLKNPQKRCSIAVVGKYTWLKVPPDSYKTAPSGKSTVSSKGSQRRDSAGGNALSK